MTRALARADGVTPWRFACLASTVILLTFAAIEGWFVTSIALGHSGTIGMDYTIYMDRARSWLTGSGFYLPWQLAGPYTIGTGIYPALYPPTVLWLLAPFTFLPAVLWWAVPLGIIAASLRKLHPALWTWPILALVLCYPRTWLILLYGNPSLWAFAFLLAGLAWTWPLPFVALKPTLAPFALLGIRRRSFWAGVLAFALLSLPFGAMWLDYLAALRNAQGGPEYLLGELPIGLALVAARARSGERPS